MDAAAVRSRRLIFCFYIAVALIFLGVGIQYAMKSADSRSAFVRWRSQVQALIAGVDVYQLHAYPNGPIMALILYPISLLERQELGPVAIDLGAMTWFFLKVGMTVAIFFMTIWLIQEKEHAFPPWARAAMLLLALQPIVGDLSHGNVNLFIFFLVTAALCVFRRGFDFSAGLLLALGICCKLTPALFIVYFLWKRAWKTVAGVAVGLGLFSLLIPGLFFGLERTWDLNNHWFDALVWPYVRDGEVWTEHPNQSIPGLIYRLTTDNPSFLHKDVEPTGYHNVLSLEEGTAKWIVKGCGLGFLTLMCWSCRTPTSARQDWRLAAEYALVTLGMLLLSERTWKHHCVTLLLPYGVLCYYLWTRAVGPWRVCLLGSLVGTQLLMTAGSTTPWELFGYRIGAKLCEVYGAYTWSLVLLVAVLALVLWQHRASASSSSRHTSWSVSEDRLASRAALAVAPPMRPSAHAAAPRSKASSS